MSWSLLSKQRRSEFAQIVREEGPSLVVLARRLTGGHDSEDVLQSALLAAWKSFTSRTELRNPRAWLAQFVVHEAQNLIRRRHRRQGMVDVSEAEPVTSFEEAFSALQAGFASGTQAGNPEELLDHVDAGLRSALLALSDPERAIFLMRVIVDLSYKELADMFAVPVGTVMSRICRAREKLRTELRSGRAGSPPSPPGGELRATETGGQRESSA